MKFPFIIIRSLTIIPSPVFFRSLTMVISPTAIKFLFVIKVSKGLLVIVINFNLAIE